MPDYNQVGNRIDSLTRLLIGNKERERRHQERMQNFNIQNSELGLKKAVMDRDIFMSQPVTGRQAILEAPGFDDKMKEDIINSLSPENTGGVNVLDRAYPRAKWHEDLYDVVDKYKKMGADQKYREDTLNETKRYHTGMLGLKEQQRAEKDKPTPSELNYRNKANMQNLLGQFGLETDIMTDQLKPTQLNKETYNELLNAAKQYGMNVYADPEEVKVGEDTGSAWNPFDNKDIMDTIYNHRNITPGAVSVTNGELTDAPQPQLQPVQKQPQAEAPTPIDEATARQIFEEAGGDPEIARRIAKERGFQF